MIKMQQKMHQTISLMPQVWTLKQIQLVRHLDNHPTSWPLIQITIIPKKKWKYFNVFKKSNNKDKKNFMRSSWKKTNKNSKDKQQLNNNLTNGETDWIVGYRGKLLRMMRRFKDKKILKMNVLQAMLGKK